MSSSLYDCAVECLAPSETAVITTPPCPVCRGKQAQPRFSIGGMANRVVVCTDCGLGSMYPQPSAKEISDFYPPQYYGQTGAKFEPLVEMLVRLVATRHVRALVRGLPRNARVLDVGCGRGVQLGALADRGFEVHGVEYSETAVVGADPRAQIRIACRLQDVRYDSDYFDQVILWHVLEHLTHPRETLEEIHRILRPGGRLVVAVPNFSSIQANWAKSTWFHLDPPRHLFHFPLSALRRLLGECHLECQSIHHFFVAAESLWVGTKFSESHVFATAEWTLYALAAQPGSKQTIFSTSTFSNPRDVSVGNATRFVTQRVGIRPAERRYYSRCCQVCVWQD